jgi:hypothetical protein
MTKRMWGNLLRQGKCKDLIEGVCFMNGEIWINVQYLWEDTKNEDEFIKRFAKAYQHEYLHYLLLDVPKKYEYGEEKIIRRYVDKDDRWSAELERFYRNEQKNLPKRHRKRTRTNPKQH